MYRRLNESQNQNIGEPNNEIRNQIEGEESLLNIGNEALGRMEDIPNPNSNESNDDSEMLAHYKQDDLNTFRMKTKGPPLPKEIIEENLDDYYMNDLNNLDRKKRKKQNILNHTGNILNNTGNIVNGPERGMTEKEQPDYRIRNDSSELIEPLITNVEEKIGSDSGRKGKKGAKSSKKSKKSSGKNAAAPEKEEDLTQIDQSLEPVQGWDYVSQGNPAQKFKPRKKQSFGSKLASWAAYYSGKTLGKIGGFFATIGSMIKGIFTPGSGPGTFHGTLNRGKGSNRFQRRGDRSLIPGWNGAKFENKEENQNQDPDELDIDFRRVPEVWSWPIAETATEDDPEKRDAKPRDPVISVYIQQSSNKYTADDELTTGHSGIGIEYSRYNALEGHWQRYNLRFGFYMAGGMPDMAQFAVTSYNNATIPGQLMNEQGRQYDISRSYPAKAKQVRDVLRAAESYADRGGYNGYTRNCTTFAKEMIVDVAKIKGAAGVFARDDVYMHHKADAKMFLAGAGAPIAKAAMENAFEKMGNKDDLSYQNFGNKMLSREDHERYRNSLSLWTWRSTKADSPNAVAENMKRSEGGKAGMIGSYGSVEVQPQVWKSKVPLTYVRSNLGIMISDLKNLLTSITPFNNMLNENMPPEFKRLMDELNGDKINQKLSLLLPVLDDGQMKAKVTQSNLVNARTVLTDAKKNLNVLLFRYYKNDERVQNKVLPIINLLNHGIDAIDDAYANTDRKDLKKTDTDLGNLTDKFDKQGYSFTINGAIVRLTPSEYEALLQIYKIPQKALTEYARMCTLIQKKQQGDPLTQAEEKELQKYKRIDTLADNFVRAHDYMLTKEKFSQQDVDYAFALEKTERLGNVRSEMLEDKGLINDTMVDLNNPNASASGTYQMLIMKSVFGGMKDRFKNEFPDPNVNTYETRDLMRWVHKDVIDCITSHKNEMKTIIRGIKHSTEDPDKDKLKRSFSDLLTKWLFQILREGMDGVKYSRIVEHAAGRYSGVMEEAEKIITSVLNEHE